MPMLFSTPNMNRRHAIAHLAAGLAPLAGLGPAQAQAQAQEAWPSKPVRIIVPFAPGGGADISARTLAEVLAPQLGQSVVVENKPGAGSAIGVLAAAQARDGHTMLMGSNSMVINPSFNAQIGYEVARDFDAVGMVSAQPLVLVVATAFPVQHIVELVAQAKVKPGGLTAGNSGNGTLAHLASELFAGQAGVEITPVPYKGESALMPDLISGQVNFGFLNLPSVLAHIKSGRLRALAVSSPQAHADLPGVPTLRSLGYPNLEVQGWAALLAPLGTIAPASLERLADLLGKALASEPVRTRFAAVGVSPFAMNRQATAQFLAAEGSRYGAVIKARGIKPG